MNLRAGTIVAVFAALLAIAPAHGAMAAECSNDTFKIDETSVAVRVCAIAGDQLRTTVSARALPPVEHVVSYERLERQETARTIDDVSLQSLGIAKTVHLTVAVRPGSVRLEHALLVPGAVALK